MKDCATLKLVKRQIKEYVQKALLNKTEAGAQVFISRSIPTDTEALPALLVYTTNENIRRFDETPKTYQRNLTVLIECIVAGNDDDDVDVKMETLADKVEALMEVDETMGGIVNKVELSGADYQTEPEAQSPIGNLALRFDVEFYTEAIRQGLESLHTLKGMDIDWKIGHHNSAPDNVVDAEDTVNVQT